MRVDQGVAGCRVFERSHVVLLQVTHRADAGAPTVAFPAQFAADTRGRDPRQVAAGHHLRFLVVEMVAMRHVHLDHRGAGCIRELAAHGVGECAERPQAAVAIGDLPVQALSLIHI